MKTIQLNNEFEYMLIQYILETSTDKSIHNILRRLNTLKKMFLQIRDN